ncbi:MAG: hypothetical protein ACFFFT_02790 [Candidatus Thorarchaeota archaeon]
MVLNVDAINYKTGVNEDDELIWKCKVCNAAEMSIIFGLGWNNNSGNFQNLNKGMRMKWEINTVEVNETTSKIEFSIWFWTKNKSWGVKDIDSQIIYLNNPKAYTAELNISTDNSFVPFLFPIPVGEYMGNLNLSAWYDVDSRVLPTLNVKISKDAKGEGYPSKEIKIIAIYNDKGILSSYKLYTKGNVVIVDIVLEFLPFYVIPTLIILFTVLSLGIIVYIIKKYRSISLSKPKLK